MIDILDTDTGQVRSVDDMDAGKVVCLAENEKVIPPLPPAPQAEEFARSWSDSRPVPPQAAFDVHGVLSFRYRHSCGQFVCGTDNYCGHCGKLLSAAGWFRAKWLAIREAIAGRPLV